jgi:hypothetical protein
MNYKIGEGKLMKDSSKNKEWVADIDGTFYRLIPLHVFFHNTSFKYIYQSQYSILNPDLKEIEEILLANERTNFYVKVPVLFESILEKLIIPNLNLLKFMEIGFFSRHKNTKEAMDTYYSNRFINGLFTRYMEESAMTKIFYVKNSPEIYYYYKKEVEVIKKDVHFILHEFKQRYCEQYEKKIGTFNINLNNNKGYSVVNSKDIKCVLEDYSKSLLEEKIIFPHIIFTGITAYLGPDLALANKQIDYIHEYDKENYNFQDDEEPFESLNDFYVEINKNNYHLAQKLVLPFIEEKNLNEIYIKNDIWQDFDKDYFNSLKGDTFYLKLIIKRKNFQRNSLYYKQLKAKLESS